MSDRVDVLSCGILNNSNSIYYLQDDIIDNSLTDHCLRITSSNIVLDCQGNEISSDDNYAGVYSERGNITIKNCVIDMHNTSSNGKGIYLVGADASYIYNNTLVSNYYGVYLSNTDYSRIEDNNFSKNRYFFTQGSALYLDASSNNNNITDNYFYENNIGLTLIGNNNLITNANSYSDGFGIYKSNGNNYTQISIEDCTTGIGNLGISENFFESFTINNCYDAIHFDIAHINNIFKNGIISGSNSNDISFSAFPEPLDNVFLNVSYSISKETLVTGELTRKWYYRTYVNDTDGNAISGATVFAKNSSGDVIESS
jgi:parallel beta-helix repeat protein